MNNPVLSDEKRAALEDFCFRDALHDNIFPDGGLLDRPSEKDRKPDLKPKDREPWKGLKDEELRAKIYAKVESLSGQPLAELWAQLNVQSKKAEPSPQTDTTLPIPTEPPDGQLYKNRPSKSEKAPAFIQRVYGPWLNGSLTRAKLRQLDPKAEAALKNWEQYNKKSAPFDLPTVEKRNDRDVQVTNPLESSENKEAVRLRSAALRRAKKFI